MCMAFRDFTKKTGLTGAGLARQYCTLRANPRLTQLGPVERPSEQIVASEKEELATHFGRQRVQEPRAMRSQTVATTSFS
jgi:hypothetical protein